MVRSRSLRTKQGGRSSLQPAASGQAKALVPDLRSIPLFARMAREVLGRALPSHSVRTFLQGERLFKVGEPASGLFVILHGHVSVELNGTVLVPRGEYELIGEQGLLADDNRRSATVVARDLVSALWVPRPAFDLLRRDPQFILNLARALSAKLTQATKDRAYHYSKEAIVFGQFRAHVAPQVLDRLLQDETAYGAPRKTDAIVLFSDIRDFTQRSNRMAPEKVAEDLTAYLNHVVDLVHRHGGTVDKFVGDAVMAVWGAFDDLDTSHAEQAFACACRLVESASTFRFGRRPIKVGVGLNAGPVFVGNVGGDGKRQFTVLGTPVNLASRFEAKTKDLNAPIVMGKRVADCLEPEVRCRLQEHRRVEVKGAAAQRLFSFDPLKGSFRRSVRK